MGVPVKVWLGGDGPNELGGLGYDPPREDPGVLEALLLRIEPTGWRVVGGTPWRKIKKYEVGKADGEHSSVMGLVLQAWEAGAQIVAFARDTDGESGREERVRRAIAAAEAHFVPPIFQAGPMMIGGAACPAIEGWILALAGERDTDEMSKVRTLERCTAREIEHKLTTSYVAIIEAAELAASLPPGCDSLRRWLERAREVLPVAVHGVAKNHG